MKDRFVNLWKQIGGKGDFSIDFNRLISLYSSSERFYHNLFHIENCLNEFDSAKHLSKEPNLLELAIWYHDIIYDTHAKNNEENSAGLLHSLCLEAGLDESFANKSKQLILITKHNIIPQEIDERLIVDIDVSILGRLPAEFDVYEEDIRKEYSWVKDSDFNQGRAEMLKTFLKRPSIYLTDFFKNKYENQAIINLKRSIRKLRA
jgi:predicted metal-dependent HD superfamily phosphohydrolase